MALKLGAKCEYSRFIGHPLFRNGPNTTHTQKSSVKEMNREER